MPSALTRLRDAVGSFGDMTRATTRAKRLWKEAERGGTAAMARRIAAERGVFLREEYIWYVLELSGDRPRRALPEGMCLRLATAGDAEAFADLPNQGRFPGLHERMAQGAEVHVVSEGGALAFTCSIFRRRTPLMGAPDGWLPLPATTVCLEDSGTSPDFRGRGVAPAAWTAIADRLSQEGAERMLTKVAVENEPSRRAVLKAGFREATDMRVRRTGPFTRVVLTPLGAPGAEFIERALPG